MRKGLIIVLLLAAYPFYYLLFKPMAVRTNLPFTSVLFMNEHYEDSLNGDYLHCIVAEVSKNDFLVFVKNMSLEESATETQYIPGCDYEWWDINFDESTLYGKAGNSEFASTYAAYSNGKVYYVSHDL